MQLISICVAMLHSSEAFSAAGDEKNRPLLQCNSLKMLIEEEVKFLIEAVTEEEKRKAPKLVKGAPGLQVTRMKTPLLAALLYIWPLSGLRNYER